MYKFAASKAQFSYVRICCDKISWPTAYEGAADPSLIQGDDGEKTSCPRCNGKVFEAEKMITKHSCYHKRCFSCKSCKCLLDYFSAAEGPDNEIYCRVCYRRAFGPGGKNKFGDKTFFEAEDADKAKACLRCGGKVFEMDKIVARGGLIHNFCLSCNDCKCNLDASNFFNGNDGEVTRQSFR